MPAAECDGVAQWRGFAGLAPAGGGIGAGGGFCEFQGGSSASPPANPSLPHAALLKCRGGDEVRRIMLSH